MQRFKGIGAYGTVGLDFAVAVVIGFLGGWWLDNKLGSTPWMTLVGLLFGTAAGFNLLFKAAKRLSEETEREERNDKPSDTSKRDDERDGESGTRPPTE